MTDDNKATATQEFVIQINSGIGPVSARVRHDGDAESLLNEVVASFTATGMYRLTPFDRPAPIMIWKGERESFVASVMPAAAFDASQAKAAYEQQRAMQQAQGLVAVPGPRRGH